MSRDLIGQVGPDLALRSAKVGQVGDLDTPGNSDGNY